MVKAHGQAWYEQLACTSGSYTHPWQQTLEGPSGEALYDTLLESTLKPELRVLEAGCGHGPDAARYAGRVGRWTGYDFTPGFLTRARREVPGAQFVEWHSGREVPPTILSQPFDLIISRRGPTSIIDHLRSLGAPDATYLAVGSGGTALASRVRERLDRADLHPSAEWFVNVRGHLPTWQDYSMWGEFNGMTPSQEDWSSHVRSQGLPFVEERYLWLVRF